MKKPYKFQLPKGFKIGDSVIEGQGLFSVYNRAKGKIIGEGEYPTHVHDKRFIDAFSRTALGTFINHSDDPNCELVLVGDAYFLKTIKKIKVGDEIFVKYGKLGIFHDFYEMSAEEKERHHKRMADAKEGVINQAKVWVEGDDKESMRILAGEILDGALVLGAWDTNVRSVFLWLSINGRGLQPDMASRWLAKKPA